MNITLHTHQLKSHLETSYNKALPSLRCPSLCGGFSSGLWCGIILGFLIAFSGTCIIHSIASNRVLTLTEPDFQYIYSWLPGIIFAGGLLSGLSEDN